MTTHKEKVEMLKDTPLDEVNGMWETLLNFGTEEAQRQFEDAARSAEFRFMPTMLWAHREEGGTQ